MTRLSLFSWTTRVAFIIVLVLINNPFPTIEGCFKSIISFGDSLADTGNALALSRYYYQKVAMSCGSPPYGETFFHRPTGRCSNGRLVIDFIAESLGLPLVPPYLGGKDKNNVNFKHGVNFAVGGATALDIESLFKKGLINPPTNASLEVQMGWFREKLPSLCKSPLECKEFLKNSLILVGEIGGNDFNAGFFANTPKEEVESYAPEVINTIVSAIKELIELGGTTLIVPGNLPIGCIPVYLTIFKDSDKEQYDQKTGCINWLNHFSQHYNELLQKEIHHLRHLHPSTTIIYADYYNAAMQFFASPNSYGFTKGTSVACCGGGGPYNYNSSAFCGHPPARNICSDPSLYTSWDGIHLTEAAYKLIANSLLDGTYTSPPLNEICTSLSPNVNHFDS